MILYNSENNIRDLRPFCRPMFCFVTAVLWNILNLSCSSKHIMRLDRQLLLKSHPSRLAGWILIGRSWNCYVCSVTATSDSQKNFENLYMLKPYHATLADIDHFWATFRLFQPHTVRRKGFGLGFVRVPHYAKSQSCVKAMSPDLRQCRGIGLRSRSLLRHAMCYS